MIAIHPLAELFPAMEGAAFEALCADIDANGLREPIVLWRGQIIDGRNRYRATIELGWWSASHPPHDADAPGWPYFLPRDDLTEADLLPFVISKNLTRRHLDESQRALVAARIANLGHGGRRVETALAKEANLPLESTGSPSVTIADAASLLNVSARSVKSARAVLEGPAQLVADVERGEVAVSAGAAMLAEAKGLVAASQEAGGDKAPVVVPALPGVIAGLDPATQRLGNAEGQGLDHRVKPGDDKIEGDAPPPLTLDETYRLVAERMKAAKAAKVQAKKDRREAKEAALGGSIAASNAALEGMIASGKRYGVILADPEWRLEPWSAETGLERAAENHYPCSSLADIMARPVAEIAAEDCVLLLWATAPMLPQALQVMAAWGFTYKSNVVWLKDRVGMGYWFRNQHEHLLVGTRGKVVAPAPGTQFKSALAYEVGAHSEKPPFAHEIAERHFPNTPKIEMNARVARPGWDLWGAEAPGGEVPDVVIAGPDPATQAEGDAGYALVDPLPEDVRQKVDPDGGVVQGAPDETLRYEPKKRNLGRAAIELHCHSDGRWMWAVNFFGADGGGGGYKVGPKWGKFAATRDRALVNGVLELCDRINAKGDASAKAMRAWATDLVAALPAPGDAP